MQANMETVAEVTSRQSKNEEDKQVYLEIGANRYDQWKYIEQI
jgi:hypothetical protein